MEILTVVGWVITGIILLAIGGVGFGLFMRFVVWKYQFLIHDRFSTNVVKEKGRFTTKEGNPNIKYFEVKGYTNLLPVKDNTSIFNGVRAWDVTKDENGDLVYLKKVKIDEAKKAQYQLAPFDKELVANTVMENNTRYKPADKMQTMMMVTQGIMIFLLVLGMGWTVMQWQKGVGSMEATAQISAETVKQIERMDERRMQHEALVVDVLTQMAEDSGYTKKIVAE